MCSRNSVRATLRRFACHCANTCAGGRSFLASESSRGAPVEQISRVLHPPVSPQRVSYVLRRREVRLVGSPGIFSGPMHSSCAVRGGGLAYEEGIAHW